MTLRTRIAAVAGVSVAVAVLAAAVGLYVAVSTDLRGEVDKGLRARASAFMRAALEDGAAGVEGGAEGPAPEGLFGPAPPPGAPPPRRAWVLGEGALPSRVQPAPFGGASGYVQFVTPAGHVQVPAGQGASPARIAPTASDEAIAKHGSGSELSDRTVQGMKLRVLTEGIGARGAVMVARPLGEVDSELNRLLEILAIVGAAGIALAVALGAARRAGGAGAGTAVHRTDGDADRGGRAAGGEPRSVAAAGGRGRR